MDKPGSVTARGRTASAERGPGVGPAPTTDYLSESSGSVSIVYGPAPVR
jgi:hypothetical protein